MQYIRYTLLRLGVFLYLFCLVCTLTSCTATRVEPYTYVQYSDAQQRFRNFLQKLSPEKLEVSCKTQLTEHEATEVLTDFLLYDPYSYWIQPDYMLYIDGDTLYLRCQTDYTPEQRAKVDAALTAEISTCVKLLTEQAQVDVERAYKALFTYLYDSTALLDGTYRAPIKCCLLDKACNCQGYAYAFMYICRQAGLSADIQYGNYYFDTCTAWTVDKDKIKHNELLFTRSNAGHVWNVVYINDEMYFLDIYAQKLCNEPTPQFYTPNEFTERYYLW